jgi:hypothetical protein
MQAKSKRLFCFGGHFSSFLKKVRVSLAGSLSVQNPLPLSALKTVQHLPQPLPKRVAAENQLAPFREPKTGAYLATNILKSQQI